MRVLILTQYYKPEPLPKPAELAEGLQQRGHQVTVLTAFPNYPSGRFFPGYSVRPWAETGENGVRVIRLALYPDHSKSAIRRIANYGSFAAAASILGPILSENADVMFVFHPPLTVGIPAYAISKFRRMPFIYSVADLWPEAVVAAGMIRDALSIKVLEVLERFAYANAAAITVVTPAMVDHLIAKGVPREKLHVITDWADEQTYQPVDPDPDLAQRVGLAGKFNVMFAGQLGIVQALDTVVLAAEELKNRPEIQLVIVGDGVERDRLEGEVAGRGLKNVRFLGRKPSEAMSGLYALADVLLVHLSAQPIFQLSVPAKLYAYMACEKPILMAVDGYGADLVSGAKIGLTCSPENPQALAGTVLQFASMSPGERKEMGRRARETFLHHYSRSVVLNQCEALLRSVASRRFG